MMPDDEVPPATDEVPPATKELVRIVELDYERTAKFIEGVIGTSAAIRGLLVTAWLAVVSLAVNTGRWPLAAVSFAVVLIFGLIDAYHSWLYDQALRHAIELESVSGKYYAALARGGDDPDAEDDLQAHLQAHRFGVYRNLRRFRVRDLRFARPKIFFQILYPALLLISAIVAVLLGVTGNTAKQTPSDQRDRGGASWHHREHGEAGTLICHRPNIHRPNIHCADDIVSWSRAVTTWSGCGSKRAPPSR
jgi:hypothetical protein